MLIHGERVGGNIDMTVNGHIGGEKLLCEKGCIVQRKATKRAKHFTGIGITNLLVEPICCIVFIEGKEEFFDIMAGIDFSKEKVGYESDGEEYFRTNVGSDKYHSGGPICTYKRGKSSLSCRIF